ncbi:hypothetical protein ACFL2V_16210 [Pseudomonadota bacterium]
MSEQLNLRKFKDSVRPSIRPLTSIVIDALKREIQAALKSLGIPDNSYFFDVGYDDVNEPRHRLLLQENGFGFGTNQEVLGSPAVYVSFSPACLQINLHCWNDVLDSSEDTTSFTDVDSYIASLSRGNFIAREVARQIGIDFQIEPTDGVHYNSPEYEYKQTDPATTVQEIMKVVSFVVKANMAKTE